MNLVHYWIFIIMNQQLIFIGDGIEKNMRTIFTFQKRGIILKVNFFKICMRTKRAGF